MAAMGIRIVIPAVHIRKTCGFSHSRASPYENRHGQIRLQAADLPLTVFALLIAYAYIISAFLFCIGRMGVKYEILGVK